MMIYLYETGGCLSCRKAKAWLEDNHPQYRSNNIQNKRIKFNELKLLFSLSNDIYDVVSRRSTPVASFKHTHGCDLEDLSFNQLTEFLQQNPTAMKRPLLNTKCFSLNTRILICTSSTRPNGSFSSPIHQEGLPDDQTI